MNKEMEVHRRLAVELFNGTWDLMEKEARSDEDNLKMIHMAHASCYHWSLVGEPVNQARGEWQISRVYAILSQGESALFHAKASLAYCEKEKIGDFDLAFAYEAVARANGILKDEEQKDCYLLLARKASLDIDKVGDRDYFLKELGTLQD